MFFKSDADSSNLLALNRNNNLTDQMIRLVKNYCYRCCRSFRVVLYYRCRVQYDL